jgi:hypothetical protein
VGSDRNPQEASGGGERGGTRRVAPSTASGETGGSLPFTGFAALALGLIATGLLTAGAALRRASRIPRLPKTG